MITLLATQLPQLLAMENPFAKFGVSSWEPLVANAIAFFVAVFVLKVFALGPIRNMLEGRRQRIAEGEEMRAKSEQTLNEVEQRSREIMEKAHQDGNHVLEEAKALADTHLEQKKQEALKMVEDIMAKSREASALEAQQAREALRTEFSRLIAQTTAQVTGKVLTDADKRTIDQSAIDAVE